MAEKSGDVKRQTRKKLGSQLLRERMGGVPKALLALSRDQAATHKKLRAALKEGPKTVPELVRETGIASREVFWNLVALSKYGEVQKREERDGYFAYALPQGSGGRREH